MAPDDWTVFDRMRRKAGLPPGTVTHVGEKKMEDAVITVLDFDAENVEEERVEDVEECFPFRDSASVTWINVDGLHDTGIIETLADHFGIHPLLQEDIVNTGTRPKVEEFDDHIFLTVKMLDLDTENEVVTEQVSVVLGDGFVLSFQETEGDVFDGVRERIRKGKGKIRKRGADYLAYALLDAVVDNYFVVLEGIGDRIEAMEDELVDDPSPRTLQTIHGLKSEMVFLRRAVWPLREVVNTLQRTDTDLIAEGTRPYLRDVYDHTVHVIETAETFRDMVSGMLDVYLSSISNRMNEVMKVLTVIATIFIPLTFIAGVYGMNFNPAASPLNMPELNWYWGYPATLLLMLAVAGVMVAYFRRRRWL